MGVRQDAGPVHVGYYDAHGERERRRSARTESYPAEFLPRDSIFEQLEKEVLPPEEVPRTLYGIQNALWLLVALAFVRPPLIRLIRREWPVIDVDFLRWIFSGFGTTFAMYLVMCTATSISFALHWLTLRGFLAVATRETLFRLAQCAHLVLTCRWIVNSTLSPCPSFALVMQAMVTFLKMHSYYAEVRQALQSMPDGDDISKLVNVEGFLYFWVAPTLVYRIEGYPRSEGIRSRFLVRKFGSLLGLLLVIFLLITDQFLPAFARARNTPTLETALVLVVPCAILLVSLFFIIFEVILNILGEVTLFADRHFYDDWWNATSMDEFSRKWNRPVHDWLNIYVNRSARRAVRGRWGRSRSAMDQLTLFHNRDTVTPCLLEPRFSFLQYSTR